MRIWHSNYTEIISLENLFQAWEGFLIGKRKKADVGVFERKLEDNIFALHQSLKDKVYKHGSYEEFYVRDPKIRHIHKACVNDRVVHHLVSQVLENIFDPTFYTHSYSCRKGKGTHRAVTAFTKLARKASKNNTSRLFVLKCDVKKFFANVDHLVLLKFLTKRIADEDFVWLLQQVIGSFKTDGEPKGMPIGNLTSQLFANIYLDPLDQYIKHELKVKYYIRYADDFVIMADNPDYLEGVLSQVKGFLTEQLKLTLHPNKISIRDYYLGIDFLGYVIFPKFILPRTKTKRRILRKLRERAKLIKEGIALPESFDQAMNSYLGYLSHCNSQKLAQEVKNQKLFLLTD